jgi:hypothetical protein
MPGYEIRNPDRSESMLSGEFKLGRDRETGMVVPCIDRGNGKVFFANPLALIDSDGEVVYRPQAHLLTGEHRAWLVKHPEWAKIPPLPGRKKKRPQ